MFFQIISIIFTTFTGMLDAIFSAIWNNISSFYSLYSITKAFSIDYIICATLGTSVIFALIIKIIVIKLLENSSAIKI